MSDRTANWEFSADLSTPEQARHRTADALMAWGADHLCADAALVVSELVTNAVAHAQSASRLELHYDGSTLRIGLHDTGDGTPEVREWHQDASGGLGLHVVEVIAPRWYVETDTSGKTIWCELPANLDQMLSQRPPPD